MNKNPDLDHWLEAYEYPMKPVVAAIRQLALTCDSRIEESIKWQAPTFMYKGNIASFFPKAKKHASLMFHKGAQITGDFPNLQGDGKEARSFKVFDLDDLETKSEELSSIFQTWCEMKDADG